MVGAFDDPGAGIAAGPLVAARVLDKVTGGIICWFGGEGTGLLSGLFGGDVESGESEDSEDGVDNMGMLGELSAVALGVYPISLCSVSGCSSSYVGAASLLCDVTSGKVSNGRRIIGRELLVVLLLLFDRNRPL